MSKVSSLSDQLWLITIPNVKDSVDTTLEALSKGTQQRGLCRLHKFEVPPLNHGTLDTLIALSDELGKYNQNVEAIVRKVERQHVETLSASGLAYEELKVNETSIEAYLRNFTWDFARYQHQGKKLSELVTQILTMSAQIDDELKKLTTVHSEKTQLLTTLDRKKTINLSTSDFEDFLTPDMKGKLEILDNEHLQTIFVALPKAVEPEFLREYVNLGLSLGITFNGEKLCVVAPDSAKLVLAAGEQVMYQITVLKGKYEAGVFQGEAKDSVFIPGKVTDYIEPLKAKFRERRMVFRTFSYDESKTGGLDAYIEKAKADVKESQVNLVRWSRATFGIIFPGLIHLKVISGFVESVLRYGVPVDFLAVFLDPNMKREKDLKKALLDTINHMRPELKESRGNMAADEEEDDDPDNLPFVCQVFTVIGVKSSN